MARIILAHECNLTQPNRAAGRSPQNETRPIRGAEAVESPEASEPMNFTVSLDRQTSRRSNQTYVAGGMEGSSQDDVEPDNGLPRGNQENEEVNMVGPRDGGTRSRGLTVRISERPESYGPIPPEGASTPLEEVKPSMLENLAVSSVRPDYRRQLEMDTQDSEEDFLFRGSRRYPNRGAGAFSSASRGDQRPSGSFSSYGRGAAQSGPPPRQPSQSTPPELERRGQQWERSEQSQERGRREERSQRSRGDQSLRRIGISAGAQAPEEAEGAMIATVRMIRATDRPIGAGRVAGSAGDPGAVQAAEVGEKRRSEVAAQAGRHRHPRRLEAEAASGPVGHRWMVSGGLPKG